MANVEYVWNRDFSLSGEFCNSSPSSRSSARRRFGTSLSSMQLSESMESSQVRSEADACAQPKHEMIKVKKFVARKFAMKQGATQSKKLPERAESSLNISGRSKDIAQRLWNR
mmetsp:Transcript_8091/g.17414  ORF Transcript_8091/g.17414 Transcript_8091/m.17414 type:complete len:113 (-) Transcript_8091:254-592(-)